MQVLVHGIDLVEVARIGRMVSEHGESFLTRCFTQRELSYAGERKRRDEHLAARFAAKEAVLKALGTGWSNGIAWTDVEVVLLPSGQPTVNLAGRAGEIAMSQGIGRWLISLSHTETFAVASAIGVSG